VIGPEKQIFRVLPSPSFENGREPQLTLQAQKKIPTKIFRIPLIVYRHHERSNHSKQAYRACVVQDGMWLLCKFLFSAACFVLEGDFFGGLVVTPFLA
jgi:branched-subunit amino acid transport protein AzlD